MRTQQNGKTALGIAVQNNRTDLVACLVEHGVRPNMLGTERNCQKGLLLATCYASIGKNPGEIKGVRECWHAFQYLLQRGAEPDVQGEIGVEALLDACLKKNDLAVAGWLLDRGVNVNAKFRVSGC
jgi:ankyrin repeat protein